MVSHCIFNLCFLMTKDLRTDEFLDIHVSFVKCPVFCKYYFLLLLFGYFKADLYWFCIYPEYEYFARYILQIFFLVCGLILIS